MADDRIFTLVGKFDDKITPSLTKLSKSISGLTRDFDKLKRNLRPIAKDMAIMAEGANRISDGFKNQRSSIDTAVRGLTEYRKELGKAASAQKQLSKKLSLPTVPIGGGGGGTRPRGGRGGRGGGDYGGMGDGYTIDKGIIAGLATNMITGIFDQIGNAVGKAVNYVKGAFAERVEDEMSDIQSAGGIFSIGKDKKVAWADTYQEAMNIQESLNAEMASLAAALPGETGQYVQNMKQVTDTTMKIVNSNGPAMIKAMQAFNGSVKDEKGAYVEATKQLAKYTTLGSLGQTGGVPLTMLAEQLLNKDKVNIDSLKRTYAALEKNALVSGALKDFEGKMNKAAAGSADRYKAMIEAFDKAFPPEVIAAMNNSVDGTFQAMKSYLMDPDIGLLGLGRKITMDFSDVGRTLGPKIDKDITVFKMFSKFFGTFGMIMGPILAEMPKLLDPLKNMMTPLKKAFVIAENAQKAILDATQGFAKKGLDFAPLRGALKGIESIARQFGGGDAKEMAKLDTMLNAKKLDLGGALQQAMKVLFSSDALEKIGKSIGEMLGGFLKMLANIGKTGEKMVASSGLAAGFMEGWNSSGGSEAISEIVRLIVGGLVKAILGLGWEALTTDPVGTAVLATVFFAPIRNMVLGFLGELGTGIAAKMAAANVGGLIAGWAPAILGGLSTWITGTVVPFLAAIAAPVAIAAAVLTVMYVFRDQIVGFFDFLHTWLGENLEGPLSEYLQGVIEIWTGVMNLIHGLIDYVVGMFSGDKAKMDAARQEILGALAEIWGGFKRALLNVGGAIAQGAGMLRDAVFNFFGNMAKALFGMKPGPAAKPQPGVKGAGTSGGRWVSQGKGKPQVWVANAAKGSPGEKHSSLGSAISSEIANKPAGSDLVIANSSETIIPAAGGLAGGMDGFVNAIYGAAQNTASVFSSGFQSFSQKIASGQQATVAAINKGTQTASAQNATMLAKLSAQNAALMTKISATPAFMGGGGGGGIALGGGYGGRGSQIAGALGTFIKKTGGAPGSIHEHPQHGGVKGRHSKNSYHYQGRAIDIGAYANEQGGVLRRVAQFNAQMGVKPVELLKAGDPGHSDHVHVAYAMGSGNPAFFSSASAADKWESMMAGKNPIVGSVRAQANEMRGGGSMTVNAPITIHQQPGQDSDQLASLVAIKLTQAVNQLRYSSYNV